MCLISSESSTEGVEGEDGGATEAGFTFSGPVEPGAGIPGGAGGGAAGRGVLGALAGGDDGVTGAAFTGGTARAGGGDRQVAGAVPEPEQELDDTQLAAWYEQDFK